jgi:hypothetical protein
MLLGHKVKFSHPASLVSFLVTSRVIQDKDHEECVFPFTFSFLLALPIS